MDWTKIVQCYPIQSTLALNYLFNPYAIKLNTLSHKRLYFDSWFVNIKYRVVGNIPGHWFRIFFVQKVKCCRDDCADSCFQSLAWDQCDRMRFVKVTKMFQNYPILSPARKNRTQYIYFELTYWKITKKKSKFSHDFGTIISQISKVCPIWSHCHGQQICF
jgi:hypothetical protein